MFRFDILETLLEPAPRGAWGRRMHLTVSELLSTTPPLPRSAQEHAGEVYGTPIPTSQITNQHSDFGPFACMSHRSRYSLTHLPRVYATSDMRKPEIEGWFRLP